jgi:hypothetical protein
MSRPAGNSFHNLHRSVTPCGIGLERKLSTTTGVTETYVAMRLGTHLDNLGTARLSTH